MDSPRPAGRHLRTLDDIPVAGRKVLVRVDFNVAIGADNKVDESEDYRIEAALPTINELRQQRCKILLLMHLGRPQPGHKEQSDLTPIQRRLEELLGEEVRMLKTFSASEVDTVTASLEPGSVLLLPNVRLDAREEMGNQKFAEELAAMADVYVNEAFSVSHRAHTSVAFVPRLLPSCAGRRTAEEINVLQKLREHPEKPYVAIASGAKISDKIGLLRGLLSQVDTLCLGGQLANVFLAARGDYVHHSYTADEVAAAKSLLQDAADRIVLPADVVVGPAVNPGTQVATCAVSAIPGEAECLCDIGPSSVQAILDVCGKAKTVLWNGPVGKFEEPAYAAATHALARGLAELPAFRVVGGGDTVVAIEELKLQKKFNHISVGGGAMVEFMEGKRMPGLEPLYE